MSDMLMLFLTGLGSLGSVVGGIFAWIQYKKARSSASEAKAVESRLLVQLDKQKLAIHVHKIMTISKKLARYTVPSNRTFALGINLQSDVDECMNIRNELSGSNVTRCLCSVMLDDILTLIKSTNVNELTDQCRVDFASNLNEKMLNIARTLEMKATCHEQ